MTVHQTRPTKTRSSYTPHLHPPSISFPETSAFCSTNPLFPRYVSTATTTTLVISQPTTTPATPKSYACSDHPLTSTPQSIPPTRAQPLLPAIIATNMKQVQQSTIFMVALKKASHSMLGNVTYRTLDWRSLGTPIYDVLSG